MACSFNYMWLRLIMEATGTNLLIFNDKYLCKFVVLKKWRVQHYPNFCNLLFFSKSRFLGKSCFSILDFDILVFADRKSVNQKSFKIAVVLTLNLVFLLGYQQCHFFNSYMNIFSCDVANYLRVIIHKTSA